MLGFFGDAASDLDTLRAGERENLVRTLAEVLADRDLYHQQHEQAGCWVRQTRQWSTIVPRYAAVYERVVNSRRAAPAAHPC